MGNVVSRIGDYMRYRGTAHWRFNARSEDEPEKTRRWKQFITETDRYNVEQIVLKLEQLCHSNPEYTISLLAHGSSVYGKRNYRDVDLLMEPRDGERIMYDEFFEMVRPDFDISFLGGFCFSAEQGLEFNLAHLFPKRPHTKPVQIGYRTNFFAEEYFEPLDGNQLIQILRRMKKPYVTLMINNATIASPERTGEAPTPQ